MTDVSMNGMFEPEVTRAALDLDGATGDDADATADEAVDAPVDDEERDDTVRS